MGIGNFIIALFHNGQCSFYGWTNEEIFGKTFKFSNPSATARVLNLLNWNKTFNLLTQQQKYCLVNIQILKRLRIVLKHLNSKESRILTLLYINIYIQGFITIETKSYK